MTQIEKIKNEIERRVDILATVSIKQAKDGDSEMSTYYHGKAVSLEELISFLDTLESEKPMNLEEEINRYLHEECSDDDEPGIHEIAEHFAEWGYLRAAEKYNEIEYNRQRAEEPVSDDLEEAAEEYAKLDEEGKWKDGGKYKGFIAGSNWQKQHDAELIEIAYNDGITIGMTKQKEQMLKEAVEADVNTYHDLVASKSWAEFVVEMPTNNLGDKVRIIVIPNTEEK